MDWQCEGCGATDKQSCICEGHKAEPCKACGSTDTVPVEAPSMYSGTDHGLECHACGRMEWAVSGVR